MRFKKGIEETLRSETLAIKMKRGEIAAFWSAVSLAISADTRGANSFLKTQKLPTRACTDQNLSFSIPIEHKHSHGRGLYPNRSHNFLKLR